MVAEGPPLQVVAMGVSGTGKTVIGSAVAETLGFVFIEGDRYHPRENIEKMSAGEPLDDDDRQPWLETLASMLRDHREAGTGAVLACSALRRHYRDTLRGTAPYDASFFLHLDLPFEVLRERMETRDHFMPASLLQSQFDTLERLGDDEHGVTLDFDAPVSDVVHTAVDAVRHDRARHHGVLHSVAELLTAAGVESLTDVETMLDQRAAAGTDLRLRATDDGLEVSVLDETDVVPFPTTLADLVAVAVDRAADSRLDDDGDLDT